MGENTFSMRVVFPTNSLCFKPTASSMFVGDLFEPIAMTTFLFQISSILTMKEEEFALEVETILPLLEWIALSLDRPRRP